MDVCLLAMLHRRTRSQGNGNSVSKFYRIYAANLISEGFDNLKDHRQLEILFTFSFSRFTENPCFYHVHNFANNYVQVMREQRCYLLVDEERYAL